MYPAASQERMKMEYAGAISNLGVQVGEEPFKTKLKSAMEQGLLLFVKYALVLVLTYVALQFGLNIVSGAANGTNAVLYLKEVQDKGYLPKVVNGSIPPKTEEPHASK